VLSSWGKPERGTTLPPEAMSEEMGSPLENVFVSTFLGSEKFVDWAKEKWIGFKNADKRNIAVLKQIKGRPLMKDIEKRTTLLMRDGNVLCKPTIWWV
jgi:hypothetical protein